MEPFSKQQLITLEQQLLKLETELTERLTSGQEISGTVTLDQSKVGRLSRMDALQQQAMAQAENHQADLKLKRVKKALGKIASGDYGFCEACDELIAFNRLSINPEAIHCILCQEKQESTGP